MRRGILRVPTERKMHFGASERETKMVAYDGNEDVGTIDIGTGERERFQFQHGPVGDNGVNGVQNEQVIELLVLRLRDLNHRLPCRENSLAITNLEQAQMWLEKRTASRVAQGLEATEHPHEDGADGAAPINTTPDVAAS